MTLPTPTLSTATTDYIPAGRRRFVFVPTIANPSAPTNAELTAGTDYTPAITAVAGFTTAGSAIDNSNFASDYMTTIPGTRSSAASTWTLKASSTSVDSRSILVNGLNGYVVIFPEGIVTAGLMDVWPVRIQSSNVDQVAKDALATISVEFAVPEPPVQNITIPSV